MVGMTTNVGHCRSKGIGGNADDKNYRCSRIIHLLNRITSALIVAMPLLGAVLKVMKSEYYLAVALLGILILALGLWGLIRNSHKTIEAKQPTKTEESYGSSSFSFLCNRCGKIHTISQSGAYIEYIILPCNGEKIIKGS